MQSALLVSSKHAEIAQETVLAKPSSLELHVILLVFRGGWCYFGPCSGGANVRCDGTDSHSTESLLGLSCFSAQLPEQWGLPEIGVAPNHSLWDFP